MKLVQTISLLVVVLFYFSQELLAFSGKKDYNGTGNESLILYQPTPHAVKSEVYSIRFNGRNGFVETMSRFDVPVHYTRLAFNGKKPLSVEVNVPRLINSFTISPKIKRINGIKKGNTLSFSIQQPGYIVLQVDSLGYLFLLIDSVQKNNPSIHKGNVINIMDYGVDSTGKNLGTKQIQQAIDDVSSSANRILYFPGGEYLTGQLNIKSNVHIYLEPGAVIKGSNKVIDYSESLLRFDHVKNITIRGYGTIDGSGWEGLRRNGGKELYLLYMSQCENISIIGTVLRDPCFWNTRVFKSTRIHLRNLKIINNCPQLNWTNTDGVDFDSSTYCDLFNAIMYTGDDNIVVKGLDTTGQYNTMHIRFENVIGISNSATAKIGTETCVKYFRDIEFKDIDVIRCKRAIVISGFDSSDIRDIRFSGFRVEQVIHPGKELPRIIDIEITGSGWRSSPGRCRISDISIHDVVVFFDLKNVESHIKGRTQEFDIKNVSVKNFSVLGKPVKSGKDGNIVSNEFVSGLTFSFRKNKK